METLLLFFSVAVVEWLIGVLSTRLIAKGHIAASVSIIFAENILGFWVFFAFVEAVNRWDVAVSYSVGACVGTAISLYLTRNMTDVSKPIKVGKV